MHLKKFCEKAPASLSAGRSSGSKEPQYDFCSINVVKDRGTRFADNSKMTPMAWPEYKEFYKNAESWRRCFHERSNFTLSCLLANFCLVRAVVLLLYNVTPRSLVAGLHSPGAKRKWQRDFQDPNTRKDQVEVLDANGAGSGRVVA